MVKERTRSTDQALVPFMYVLDRQHLSRITIGIETKTLNFKTTKPVLLVT